MQEKKERPELVVILLWWHEPVISLKGIGTKKALDLRKLNGTVIHKSANCKDLKFISKAKTLLWERRIDVAISSHD